MRTKYELRKPSEEVALSSEEMVKIALETGSHPVLVYALLNRGFNASEIRTILKSEDDCALMRTPLNGAEEAADRIISAIKSDERIGIFADYDCDGITSGFVMRWGLTAIKRALHSNTAIYLHYPQRKDGYGLSNKYCKAAKGKLDLVITVDNGIATREQEEILHGYGIDLVVTDHHEPKNATLPALKSTPIVDPCYNDIDRSYLAGVAVAYNVVFTAARKAGISLNRGIFLPAVMLGTISDCMPMSFENACYIKAGLSFLNSKDKYTKFYLDAFYDSYKKKVNLPPVITPKDISFTVAPKVNSASRMGDTNLAGLAMFLGVQDDKHTEEAVKELSDLNDKRKDETKKIVKDVVEKLVVPEGRRIVAYDGDAFGNGLHGIIASKITDSYPDYPAFVYRVKDGICAGSVRCDNEAIDCMEMFEQLKAEGLVKMCAGHSRACVLEVEEANRERFLDAFSKLYDSMDIPEVVKTYDATVKLKLLSNDFLSLVNNIPFTTQEKPVFLVKNVFINEAKKMKNGTGVTLSIADDTATAKINWWGMAKHYEDLGSPKVVNLVCSIQQDFRMAHPCASLDIIDMIPAQEEINAA